jgi:hypothetical protein
LSFKYKLQSKNKYLCVELLDILVQKMLTLLF